MADDKKKRGGKLEREMVNLKESYEVRYAAKRTKPSKNHPELTPAPKPTKGAAKPAPKAPPKAAPKPSPKKPATKKR